MTSAVMGVQRSLDTGHWASTTLRLKLWAMRLAGDREQSQGPTPLYTEL